MVIIRQKAFGKTVSTHQKAHKDSNDTVVNRDHISSKYNGSDEQREIMKTLNENTDSRKVRRGTKVNGKRVPIYKSKEGNWHFDLHYAYKDECGRLIPTSHGSEKQTTAKEFYRDMLKNEKVLFDNEIDKPSNLSEFPNPADARRFKGEKISNKDIKDAIRKIERTEKIKGVAKKAAIPVIATTALGTGIAVHKFKEKKKQLKNEDTNKKKKG